MKPLRTKADDVREMFSVEGLPKCGTINVCKYQRRITTYYLAGQFCLYEGKCEHKKMDKMSARDLCIYLIKQHLAHDMTVMTSWNWFMESWAKGFITKDIPQWKLLRAMAYGKKQEWLTAYWVGVYARDVREPTKQRCYRITEKAKRELAGEKRK